MGVSVYANGVSQSFDCGYIGFNHLRDNIALAFDKEFGEVYSDYKEAFAEPKKHAHKLNKILEDKRFEGQDDLLDFFFASECDGVVKPPTIKKIYNIIKDVDFGKKIFTYAAYSDGKDYEHFKEFLLECIKHRSYMRWC